MIHVVIPSRGRPQRASEVLHAIRATAVLPDTRAWLAIDRDDPALPEYVALADGLAYLVPLAAHETGDLVRATNSVSMWLARLRPRSIIANWGDDHIPRTVGWDAAVTDALLTPGIAYGDDGIQGEHLPTAPFISSEIVEALGWYALPTCRHLFIDDCWKALGQDLGVLRYLPNVNIEHMHPAAGKAEWDAGYERANANGAMEVDRAAFNAWHLRYRAVDVANVRAALA